MVMKLIKVSCNSFSYYFWNVFGLVLVLNCSGYKVCPDCKYFPNSTISYSMGTAIEDFGWLSIREILWMKICTFVFWVYVFLVKATVMSKILTVTSLW